MSKERRTASMITDLRALFVCSIVIAGCGSDDRDQDPEGAAKLWERIHADDYRKLERAPGYETRKTSRGPHGGEVDIYVYPVIAGAIAEGKPIKEWPVGSLIVKDGWRGSELNLVAVMEKRADGWYWAEYEGNGKVDYSGRPSVCTDCHVDGDDYVRSFEFPR